MRRTKSKWTTGIGGLVEWAGIESGIDTDLRDNFPEDIAEEIIALARYLLLDVIRVDETECKKFFRSLGKLEEEREGFFVSRAKRHDVSATVAYDSVAGNVTLCTLEGQEPIAYVRRSRGMPLTDALEDALKRLNGLLGRASDLSGPWEEPLVVTDLGDYGESYVLDLLQRYVPFLTRVKSIAEGPLPVRKITFTRGSLHRWCEETFERRIQYHVFKSAERPVPLILLTNTDWDAREAFVHDRFRERIAEFFQEPERASDGLQFVRFVALCYRSFLRRVRDKD